MQTMTETLQKLIGKPLVESTDQEIYLALLDLVRSKSAAQVRPVNGRKLYYISAEFLIGKLLSNNLINLGLYDDVKKELEQGIDPQKIIDDELLTMKFPKIFINHRLISVCQTLRKMPKKEKRTIRMLIFPMMRTRMTIRMISCHGPRFRKLLMRLQH